MFFLIKSYLYLEELYELLTLKVIIDFYKIWT